MSKSQLDYKLLSVDKLNVAFIEACMLGDMHQVIYLLTSKELQENADIHFHDDDGFRTACEHGNTQVAKYLLTSPNLKEHANIHAANNEGLRWACWHGNLELVKFLTSSPELKEHSNPHINDDEIFYSLCLNSHLDILNYLIFDLNIVKNENIRNSLQKLPNPQVEQWFELRELSKKLKNELANKDNNNKRSKL